MTTDLLQRGDQIVYMPSHTDNNPDHPDAENGFVTLIKEDTVFCRYWNKYRPGELRTKANSEGTPIHLLIKKDTVPQLMVKSALKNYCMEMKGA